MKLGNYDNSKMLYLIIGLVIGVFSGIAFIENWLLLKKEYPKSKYVNIPLDPAAWGTISDWLYLLITIFTAYYLVRTFIEQKNINRSSLLPIFSVEKETVYSQEKGYYVLRISLVKNSAYYFAPSKSYSDFFVDLENKLHLYMYLPEGSIIEIQTKGSDYNTTNDGAIIITLYTYSFRDVANNTYFQSLTFNRQLNIFSLSVPQLKDKKS